MSAVLDTYDRASRFGWKIAHPWPDSNIDIFRRGDVVIVACWGPDEVVTSAYAFSTDGTGALREYPNRGDVDGRVAVLRWLSEGLL